MIFFLYIWTTLGILMADAPWYHAQNLEEFTGRLQQELKGSLHRDLCRSELEGEGFPEHCLYHLDFEMTDPTEYPRVVELFKELQAHCQLNQAMPNLTVAQTKDLLILKSLPISCRQILEVHMADLEYLKTSAIGPNIE